MSPISPEPVRQSVWPPPATRVPVVRLRPGFMSLRNLVLPICVMVAFLVVLEPVSTILSIATQGGSTGTIGIINALVSLVILIVDLTMSITFYVWLYRAYGNLKAFCTSGQSFTAGWAVGWYFVPIYNLFRPYSAMVELWKASNPAVDSSVETEWRSLEKPETVNTWWIAFLLGNFVWLLILPSFLPHVPQAGYMDFFAVASGLVAVASLALQFRVVRGLSDLQERKEVAMVEADRGEVL